jgi:ABC-type spermidine/putrescine transport system permease subunit II
MENQKITTVKTALNFGLILGGISLVYSLMLFFLDMHYQGETATSLIGYTLLIGLVLWAIMHFKKNNDGYISLSEALKTGVGTVLISAIIVCIYTIVMIQYLDPEFLDKSIEYQKQKMLQENPEISLESVNKMFSMQKEFSGPFIISGFIIIFNLFFGFIISLIVGLIVKKSKPE